jgi:ABC-type glycerol-3-phosphate transport system substrate-binding protein
MKTLRWSAASAAIVAAALVAGCGGRSSGPAAAGGSASSSATATVGPPPDAAALGRQVKSAEAKATSVHVSAALTQGHAYVKVTSALLKSQNLPTAACALVCGRYLKVPPSQAKSMLADVQWSSLLGRLKSMPKWSYVRTVTVNGQPAWQLRAADGSAAYVAAQGPPYPLRLMKGFNRIDFTQWNAVTIPPPPPASQVVDLSQLQR